MEVVFPFPQIFKQAIFAHFQLFHYLPGWGWVGVLVGGFVGVGETEIKAKLSLKSNLAELGNKSMQYPELYCIFNPLKQNV